MIKSWIKSNCKFAMTSHLDDSARDEKTWQAEFSEEMDCPYCNGKARFAFVSHEEGPEEEDGFVCDKYENDPEDKGYWPHDSVAVAVYICKDCMKPVADMNQA